MSVDLKQTQPISSRTPHERRNILIFYAVYFASLLITMVPISSASVLALMFSTCMLAAAYSIRLNATKNGFLANHLTFMIRTFWRANFYLLFTVAVSLMYLFLLADYDTIGACFNTMYKTLQHGQIEQLIRIAIACEQLFFEQNEKHFHVTAFIAFTPIVGYVLYRCTLGWMFGFHHKVVPEGRL